MSIDAFIKNASKRQSKQKEITEANIEQTFCNYAKSKDCLALKLLMLNKRGFPDRTILCPGGKVFFVEFKRKGGKVSGPQIKIRDMLESFGFKYYVCDEIGQAEQILDEFLL